MACFGHPGEPSLLHRRAEARPGRAARRRTGLAAASLARCVLLAAIAWLASASVGAAQTGRQVLILVNGYSDVSVRIGRYYAEGRGVPTDQIINLTLPERDEISRHQYTTLIEEPLLAWFAKSGAQDRILYLVATKGVPLRIAGTQGLDGAMASVDSELTLLYRRMAGLPVAVDGRVANPYYLGARPIDALRPFTHEAYDIFLVTRLDGFTRDDVIGLIDRGRAPAAPDKRGAFVLDQRAPSSGAAGDVWLDDAAARLRVLGYGDQVILERSGAAATDRQGLLGYYSWGSNDAALRRRALGFTFLPGALAGMFVSTDGRTFTAPPASWRIGTWEAKASYYAGSPQSLAGDAIRAGVTGLSAHVAEPYLDAAIRPQILFPAYVSGFNLAEAYYQAMPYLSWQTVIVGDPLCAPFPRDDVPARALDPPIDPVTELPAYLSARRVATTRERFPSVDVEAVRLALRGEGRLARGDHAGATTALEAALAREPRYLPARHLLARVHDALFSYDEAFAQYRQILAIDPDDVAALNNLAYGLAARGGQAGEARSFAERAYTLSSGAPEIADTLGWVLHLTGDERRALRYLQHAAQLLPNRADVHWHYATVLAATGDLREGARELTRALQLDPTLKTRPEVTSLQRTLTRGAR